MMNYIGNYDYYLEKHEAMIDAHFRTENAAEPTGGIVDSAHQRQERQLKLPEKRRNAARTQAKLDWKPRRKSRPARKTSE